MPTRLADIRGGAQREQPGVRLADSPGNAELERWRLGLSFLTRVLFFAAGILLLLGLAAWLSHPSLADIKALTGGKGTYAAYKEQQEAWRGSVSDTLLPLATALLTLVTGAIGVVAGQSRAQ